MQGVHCKARAPCGIGWCRSKFYPNQSRPWLTWGSRCSTTHSARAPILHSRPCSCLTRTEPGPGTDSYRPPHRPVPRRIRASPPAPPTPPICSCRILAMAHRRNSPSLQPHAHAHHLTRLALRALASRPAAGGGVGVYAAPVAVAMELPRTQCHFRPAAEAPF